LCRRALQESLALSPTHPSPGFAHVLHYTALLKYAQAPLLLWAARVLYCVFVLTASASSPDRYGGVSVPAALPAMPSLWGAEPEVPSEWGIPPFWNAGLTLTIRALARE
jgi:hypothetical protein